MMKLPDLVDQMPDPTQEWLDSRVELMGSGVDGSETNGIRLNSTRKCTDLTCHPLFSLSLLYAKVSTFALKDETIWTLIYVDVRVC